MHKKLIITYILLAFITILLLFNFLGGCIDNIEKDDNEKIEILNYTVRTIKRVKSQCCYENIIFGEGFVHGESIVGFVVNGTIKNISGTSINNSTLLVTFLDINNKTLFNKSVHINNFTNSSTFDFKVTTYDTDRFFSDIQNVKFDFKI